MMELVDAKDREAAVRERDRNVLVDASAGTGKTSLVVDRVLNLVAPSDGADAIPITRLAVITFTRKAAGELRFRIRQKILSTLSKLDPNDVRHQPLKDALGELDMAHIGTIHAFADRLLRLFPQATGLDPVYTLVEDNSELVREALQHLIESVDGNTLATLLAGTEHLAQAEEFSSTMLDLQRAGLRMESLETDFWTYHGLDGLVATFIQSRDAEMPDVSKCDFDQFQFERFRDEYIELTATVVPDADGARWLLHNRALMERLRDEHDTAVLYRELVDRLERGPRGRSSELPTKKEDFAGDAISWDAWKAFSGDTRQEPVRAKPLRDDLLGPLREWMALRIARLRPVVLHLYEQVKLRHRVVDQIDLLLKLRNLLRDRLNIRGELQQLFDHVFVDEFQDTDPLQAECVLFLCEQSPTASRWDLVALAPGKLTIVGDPKQSIYRFRRADIATYRSVCDVVRRSPHAAFRLSASFRTAPTLVDWLNDRFSNVLGVSLQGEAFRETNGDVFYQPLSHGRSLGPEQPVRVVPFELAAPGNAADYRKLEASAIARYVRWMTTSELRVNDPLTGVERPISYGDVAVLSIVTTNLPLLFRALDNDDVPYSARGGSLFVRDPLHQQFILALSALADPDDGVAMAALLRPPFFALSLADLARGRNDVPSDGATQARAIVAELRRRRFERGAGVTARALLEETGFARSLAIGPNGSQRLTNLRELCFEVERRAQAAGTDFDETIRVLREWINEPVHLDPPHPVGGNAVRILTVHQAKGLEFPVVVLWDGRGTWNERLQNNPFEIDRTGRGWSIRLDALKHEQPPGLELAEREQKFREAERKRLVYVAATRARDFLVLPQAGALNQKSICGTLIDSSPIDAVVIEPVHRESAPAAWFTDAAPAQGTASLTASKIESRLRAQWSSRVALAKRPFRIPIGVTSIDDEQPQPARVAAAGRFGPVFGETVHRAIGLVLRRNLSAEEAVSRAVLWTKLQEHHQHAVADVARGVDAVKQLVTETRTEQSNLRLEHPVYAHSEETLVVGYIDLLIQGPEATIIIDFKTDVPPTDNAEVAARYVAQLVSYKTMLGTQPRAGLLFTGDGGIRWFD
jgi:ATP-dependent helicase/nuclease subunit A